MGLIERRMVLRAAACREQLLRHSYVLPHAAAFELADAFFKAVIAGQAGQHAAVFAPELLTRTIALSCYVTACRHLGASVPTGLICDDQLMFDELITRHVCRFYEGAPSEEATHPVGLSPHQLTAAIEHAVASVVAEAVGETAPTFEHRVVGCTVASDMADCVVAVEIDDYGISRYMPGIRNALHGVAKVLPLRGVIPARWYPPDATAYWTSAPTLDLTKPPMLDAVRAFMRGDADDLWLKHSNLVAMFIGAQARDKKWTGAPALVLVVTNKGAVPFGEVPFPRSFKDIIDVDVEEGSVSLSVHSDRLSLDTRVCPSKKTPLCGGASISADNGRASVAGTLGLVVQQGGRDCGLTCAHIVSGANGTIVAPAVSDSRYYAPTRIIGTVDVIQGPEHTFSATALCERGHFP